jgi:hypothetical protein
LSLRLFIIAGGWMAGNVVLKIAFGCAEQSEEFRRLMHKRGSW